jgi:16S rRNA (adenine1518-N6/adenine1519-N6)-dimethyltransferase
MSRLPTPSKELGQHFLVDENILRVIERLAEIQPDEVVLEIGPGQGVLTAFLAERAGLVHAVELDRRLQPHLEERFGAADKVQLHFADALRLDPGVLEPPPSKLVANLPYNVATPIVVESLDGLPSVTFWCVMVQREVADRFFAQPGTKAYGAVSVLIQLAAERTGSHAVSREVFRPRPNVDSALLAFRRRDDQPPVPWLELKRVVEGAFAHRRKRLPNSLELTGLADRERVEAALAKLGRPPTTRAEELTPPDFVELTTGLR